MRILAFTLASLAAGALAACAPRGPAAPAKPAVGPAIDEAEAERGAADLVTEIHDTLRRGNKDSLFTLLDDALVVYGPRPADLLGTRADALVALGEVVDPKAKRKLALKSGKLQIVPSPGGRSAWAFDTLTLNGKPHATLAVLSNAADLWLVAAVALAATPTAAQLEAEAARDAVAPPGARAPSDARKIDPQARLAVEKFERGLLDPAVWRDDLVRSADAIVAGPTSGEVARGKKAIRALWERRTDARTRAALAGELSAAVTADGQLAWISAPLTRVEGDGDPLPLRAFAVYRRDGAGWTLTALHEAVAIGEPGAGAAFERIAPPKLPEARPVRVAADDAGKGAAPGDAPKKKKGKPTKKKARAKKLVEREGPDADRADRAAARAAAAPKSTRASKRKKPAAIDEDLIELAD